jgi:hypothetical protein
MSCPSCLGEGRVDLNAGWRGPPGVVRENWVPCPDCDGVPEPPRVELNEALVEALRASEEYELADIAEDLLRKRRQ